MADLLGAQDWVKGAWAFKGADETELVFDQGAVIRVMDRPHPDWWQGTVDGRTGLFPSNYAKTVSSDGQKVMVLYDFDAGSDHDIRRMAKGDIITVLEKPETGWWLGRIASGETGLFPSNYVKAIDDAPAPPPIPVSSLEALKVSEPPTIPLGNPSEMPIIASLDAFDSLVEDGFVVEQDEDSPNGQIMTGEGEIKRGQVVDIHCVAMAWNGAEGIKEEFASTRSPKPVPMRFALDGASVTKGLTEGVIKMKIGQRAVITCSPSMAYGEAGMPPLVKPNAFVIYHVEVLSVDGTLTNGPTGPIELLQSSVTSRGDDGRHSVNGRRPSVMMIAEGNEQDEGHHEGLMIKAAQSLELN
mmetsp:Transcript_13847/g.16496  ORF Transcript_13847/g.16496 Transcript_13847/m.16496 type:complete len:356 (-) Transcript_13847:90-1157(-)